MKEAIDKPRIYHQLIPMVIDYEYGVTKVSRTYHKYILHRLTKHINY